jgi:L-ascorbate metabolism protein UlaG (beta-lactamase superfamily)
MRLTKFGHACVRIEHDGAVVVLDPGVFTEPEAVEGATAVLITHEHSDHWSPEHLARTAAPILTIGAVAAQLPEQLRERVTVLEPGGQVDVGVPVTVVGEKHAVIHPELPHFDNSGYLLTVGDTRVFHPGDALTVPDEQVDLLLLPVSAPWLKVSEAIDYGREVGAPRNLAIHDAIYSEAGLNVAGAHLERFLGAREQEYVRLQPGTDL